MERKFRAILIDDEPFCTAGLEIDLKETCPNVDVIAMCNSAKEGMKQIKLLQPDVVFLDIEMPWMNGLELVEMLQPIDFEIIFITAYDEFAVKAFRLSAIDYLMKPVERSLLKEAVLRLEGKSSETNVQQQKVSQLFHNIKEPVSTNPKITVPNRDGIDLIPVHDIIYCKANSSYTEILLLDGTKKLVSRVLKDIGFQLDSFNFLRVHQSFLINMEHLKSYHRSDGGFVEMINGDHISVSRSRKQELHSRLSL
jgi:two-component system LytT family response regulator